MHPSPGPDGSAPQPPPHGNPQPSAYSTPPGYPPPAGYSPPPGYPPAHPYPGAQPTARPGTSWPLALVATAVWGGVQVVLSLVVGISMIGINALDQLGYLIGRSLGAVLIVSLFVWLTTRRRTLSIWILILIALPFYLGLGIIMAAGAAAGGR